MAARTAPPHATQRESSMLPYRSKKDLRVEDYRVQLTDRPGWVWGSSRLPRQGEEVFCAAGAGTVTGLAGRTGNGSRLVQIALRSEEKQPFFAAASNVLLPPMPVASEIGETVGIEGSSAHPETDVWFR
jgi:hypothetical protein